VVQALILPGNVGLTVLLAMTIGAGRVEADDKPTETALLAVVEHELQLDATFELRWSLTEDLVKAGLYTSARASVAEMERLAVKSVHQAAVARLAIAAGDAPRATRLVEQADLAFAKLEGEELYLDDVVRTFELLGDERRAARTFRRLDGDDRWICAQHVAEDLVRTGHLERAEGWAVEASGGGDAAGWLAVAHAWAEGADRKRARRALTLAVRLAKKDKLLRGAHLSEAAAIYASLGDGAKAAALARKVLAAIPMGGTEQLIRAALAGKDHESADKIVKDAWDGEWKPDHLQNMLAVARYYLAFELPVPTREDTDRRSYAEKILAFVEAHVAGEQDEPRRIGLYADLARARLVTGDIVRAVEHANAVPQRATRLMVLIEIAGHLHAGAAAAAPPSGPSSP